MIEAERRLSGDEVEKRGHELFESVILPQLPSSAEDQYCAIDVETGEYELNNDDYQATQTLLKRSPRAQIWMERVGQPAAYRIGWFPQRSHQ